MGSNVLLLTDRSQFEQRWRSALQGTGLSVERIDSAALSRSLSNGSAVVIDAGCDVFDEDELLASVGLARALRAVTAVALPEENAMSEIAEVLEDLAPGLVARGDRDVERVAGAIGRRCDRGRSRRFEYLTVSPRPNELLAILGDGTSALLSRPVADSDDGSEVSSISLGSDAETATLTLGSGNEVQVNASSIANRAGVGSANGNGAMIDGARLGARLRELRHAAGLTQAELARRTGIHRPNIARVEAGRHTPSLETLARLANAIGVPTTQVLAEE